MTIRELQYAIQDAIDKGVPDDARVELEGIKNPTILAVEYDWTYRVSKRTVICEGADE